MRAAFAVLCGIAPITPVFASPFFEGEKLPCNEFCRSWMAMAEDDGTAPIEASQGQDVTSSALPRFKQPEPVAKQGRPTSKVVRPQMRLSASKKLERPHTGRERSRPLKQSAGLTPLDLLRMRVTALGGPQKP